jgi:hypothetical protein
LSGAKPIQVHVWDIHDTTGAEGVVADHGIAPSFYSGGNDEGVVQAKAETSPQNCGPTSQLSVDSTHFDMLRALKQGIDPLHLMYVTLPHRLDKHLRLGDDGKHHRSSTSLTLPK